MTAEFDVFIDRYYKDVHKLDGGGTHYVLKIKKGFEQLKLVVSKKQYLEIIKFGIEDRTTPKTPNK